MYIQATHAPCRPVTQPGRPFVGIGAMSLSTIDGWHIQGPIFFDKYYDEFMIKNSL